MNNTLLLENENDHFNHFEYNEADAVSGALTATGKIQSTAAKNVPGGEVLSQLPSWQSVVGGLLKSEDKSATGFNKFKSTFNPLPFYPTRDEMIKAAQLGRWEAAEAPAIQSSYNPQDGTWKRGDWSFQVISTSPITVKDFKGSNETHTFSAPLNAKVPMSVSPQNATVMASAPSGSGEVMTMQSGTQALNYGSDLPSQKNKGAGDLTQQVKNLLPGGGVPSNSNQWAMVGAFVVIIIIILFVALKK